MEWVYLLLAGCFEVVWSTTMKLSDGLSQLGWASMTILGQILSFICLSLSLKTMNLSLAYPIWTGIGTVGSIIVGILLFKDRLAPITWFFVACLIIGIVGIKVTH